MYKAVKFIIQYVKKEYHKTQVPNYHISNGQKFAVYNYVSLIACILDSLTLVVVGFKVYLAKTIKT